MIDETLSPSPEPHLRADLHVHSYHSGYASHLRFLKTRDCYSDPLDVYRVAKQRGMDLVCLTDHDSLDGCLEFLDRYPDAPDFICGEEVECTLPARSRGERTSPPVRIHIGVLGMTEAIHRDVQPLRRNVFELVEYLNAQDVFFALNHLFFFVNQRVATGPYLDALLPCFSALETRNGAMCRDHNELIGHIARTGDAERVFTAVGGSDAHTLRHVGRTWTEAPGRTREEFLAALRAGRSTVGGEHGSTVRMAGEIYSVIGSYWAGLAGHARHDLRWSDRLVGSAFSLASLPFQFIPAVVALTHKTRERATIERVSREWIHERRASTSARSEAATGPALS
jgi:predicted metal-dependent phosphoesterase TrpH